MIYYACRDGACIVSTIHKSGFIIGWWSPIVLSQKASKSIKLYGKIIIILIFS